MSYLRLVEAVLGAIRTALLLVPFQLEASLYDTSTSRINEVLKHSIMYSMESLITRNNAPAIFLQVLLPIDFLSTPYDQDEQFLPFPPEDEREGCRNLPRHSEYRWVGHRGIEFDFGSTLS